MSFWDIRVEYSFPVNPEVGKIGTNSPTYIQPVAERSDGIKSFFQKQHPSPAKPKTSQQKSPTKQVKTEARPEESMKDDLKSEITPDDEEKGLGDDSNAPNPATKDEKPSVRKETEDSEDIVKLEDLGVTKEEASIPSKRKREEHEEQEEEKGEKKKPEKHAGRQTKVIRKSEDDAKTDVSDQTQVLSSR